MKFGMASSCQPEPKNALAPAGIEFGDCVDLRPNFGEEAIRIEGRKEKPPQTEILSAL